MVNSILSKLVLLTTILTILGIATQVSCLSSEEITFNPSKPRFQKRYGDLIQTKIFTNETPIVSGLKLSQSLVYHEALFIPTGFSLISTIEGLDELSPCEELNFPRRIVDRLDCKELNQFVPDHQHLKLHPNDKISVVKRSHFNLTSQNSLYITAYKLRSDVVSRDLEERFALNKWTQHDEGSVQGFHFVYNDDWTCRGDILARSHANSSIRRIKLPEEIPEYAIDLTHLFFLDYGFDLSIENFHCDGLEVYSNLSLSKNEEFPYFSLKHSIADPSGFLIDYKAEINQYRDSIKEPGVYDTVINITSESTLFSSLNMQLNQSFRHLENNVFKESMVFTNPYFSMIVDGFKDSSVFKKQMNLYNTYVGDLTKLPEAMARVAYSENQDRRKFKIELTKSNTIPVPRLSVRNLNDIVAKFGSLFFQEEDPSRDEL